MTGWGYTTNIRFGRSPNDLQQIKLNTLTNEDCVKQGIDVDSTGICTGAPAGKGACGVSRFDVIFRAAIQL